MAFWSDGLRGRSTDDLIVAGDKSLNLLVAILLVLFALGSVAYYYGQRNPRISVSTAGQAVTASPQMGTPEPARQ